MSLSNLIQGLFGKKKETTEALSIKDITEEVSKTVSNNQPEEPLSSELESEVREMVQRKVKEGFDSYEEIVDCVTECVEDEHSDVSVRMLAQQMTKEAIARHLQEQSGWSFPTDCDRLDAGFMELEESGIVARQNFTCCQTCGHAEIGDEISEAIRTHSVVGYTFYHMQDTESAAEGGGIYLAYGALEEGEEPERNIGHKIVEVLKKHNLNVQWDGNIRTRIFIGGLDWKKRR